MYIHTMVLLGLMAMAYKDGVSRLFCAPVRLHITNVILSILGRVRAPAKAKQPYYLRLNSIEGALCAAYLKRASPNQKIFAVPSSPCVEFPALYGVPKTHLDLVDSTFDYLGVTVEWQPTKKTVVVSASSTEREWESKAFDTPYRGLGKVFFEPVGGWVNLYYRLLTTLDGVKRACPRNCIVHVADVRLRRQGQRTVDGQTVALDWEEGKAAFETYPVLAPAVRTAMLLHQQLTSTVYPCATYKEMLERVIDGCNTEALASANNVVLA